jgi:hypothetical protein
VLFVVPGNEQRISRGVAMSRLSGENCQNFAKEAQFGGTIGESKDFVVPGEISVAQGFYLDPTLDALQSLWLAPVGRFQN